ncbi:MAG: efflux transporter outer membrane subunit [Burkholderiaceae bacterium]|nr:efflux transporter outer membrane subunit [Burkholderiaceae bacterium]
MRPTSLPACAARAATYALALALMLAFALGGCAVAPASVRAPEPAAATWSAPLPHDGSAEALAHWWSRFDDLALAQLIDRAQRENPTLEQAAQRIVEARANARIAGAALAPTLQANASATRGNTLMIGAGLPAATTMSSATLDARWEVDLFGAARNREAAALARVEGSHWQWHDARVSLAAEVADAYVGLRMCEALVELFDAQAQSLATTEALTERKTDEGFAAPADLALARATAAEARSRATAQRADCDVALGQLAMLTAQPTAQLRASLAPRYAQLPEPRAFAVDSVPARVLSQRPDLAAAERAALAAAAEVGAAQADRFPRLALAGSIGRSALHFAGQTLTGSTWSFAPSIAASLFDAGRREASVDAARARLAIAEADWRARALGAVREVEQALVRLDAAARRLYDARRAVDGYRSFLDAATAQWEAGAGSLLDLEQARRNAQNASATLVQTRRERVSAWLALYKAVGGDWMTE